MNLYCLGFIALAFGIIYVLLLAYFLVRDDVQGQPIQMDSRKKRKYRGKND